MSDAERQLRLEDFHDSVPLPRGPEDVIRITVDLTDFEGSADALAVLGEYVVASNPMVSRLTYLFRSRPTLQQAPLKETDYEFLIYGGENPDRRISHEVRQQISLTLLPALRDAEGDLNNWRRSPLAPLLQAFAANTDRDRLEQVTAEVTSATRAVAQLPDIRDLANRLQARLEEIVGSQHAVATSLGFSPTDAERLVRALRLFIDGGKRSISEASLGTSNLIYLCLWILELERQVADGNKSHNLLAIEEPEAHLHPHLQRLIFRNFLHIRGEMTPEQASKANTILLTTHSPHIISVAPLRSLVVLRKSSDGTSTEAVSTANVELTESVVKDLERYLDVTRGEIVFAKGVLLVEGPAEEFIVPALGKLLGYDFDQLGITVCSVGGTDFEPYVRLLGAGGLRLPFAVITDFDPTRDGHSLGVSRVRKLLSLITGDAALSSVDEATVKRRGGREGIFLNDYTLEVDLFHTGQHEKICQALVELTTNRAAQERASRWQADPSSLDENQFLKDIMGIGKGRFAQRLASLLRPGACPGYIKKAIKYVTKLSDQSDS